MAKLILEYNAQDGLIAPDGKCEALAKEIVELKLGPVVVISSQLIMDFIRVWVQRGLIPHNEIEIRFGADILYLDKNCRIDRWPEGFCDYVQKALLELV